MRPFARRPLFINFDSFTDGDPDFKKEITELMIDNLQEMQQVLIMAFKQNDAIIFHRVCHKIKATLEMLEDKELLEIVEQLKANLTNADQVNLLDRICVDIIASLQEHK
ncbi:MAG TPA: hypothetical protein VIN08_18765 [Ohtaekwangia sp.]|uniref:hypothetical protein n=1 Tax=Ohtaekwangia sp. TaxID=2066019 RepID=UPI002F95BB17